MLEIIELYCDDNVYSNSKYLNSLYKINNYFEKTFNILIIAIVILLFFLKQSLFQTIVHISLIVPMDIFRTS